MVRDFISSDDIRARFSGAMSNMYRDEVPAYGTLMDLVRQDNASYLARHPQLRDDLDRTHSLTRISDERHGAIRLGTAVELSLMRRVFAMMGMVPVGYYDLSSAGIPVHSTAFRPVSAEALSHNPFRVFTSVLRLDLIRDEALRAEAAAVLRSRAIFTSEAIVLLELHEAQGGFTAEEAERFVAAILETFRWHDRAIVDDALYHRLHDAHRLIADVVSFRGPHINHLTPRALDIDAIQAQMPEHGIAAKAVIEGPPKRKCPILLRQTSFKALEEPVSFRDAQGEWRQGSHTARFGEIEQRGAALTPKGRALYDRLLTRVRDLQRPAADGGNARDYGAALVEVFAEFPDDWEEMRAQGLAYFTYSLTEKGRRSTPMDGTIEDWLGEGLVRIDPIVYEDFLPVSAAGIFQSNLGDATVEDFAAGSSQLAFEADLGAPVLDEFEHYRGIEQHSIAVCTAALSPAP